MLACSIVQHADARRQLGSASSVYKSEASRNILVNEKSTWFVTWMEKKEQ